MYAYIYIERERERLPSLFVFSCRFVLSLSPIGCCRVHFHMYIREYLWPIIAIAMAMASWVG